MKNRMILLVAGLLATPVAMAASPMEFYGIAHVSIDSISGTTKDLQVKSRSSRLGVKGEKTFKGDLQGFHSIRVNEQWRIVFRWQGSDALDVRLVDYH